MYRQGDVLLVRVAAPAVPASVTALPPQPRDGRGRLVLAPGGAGGHAHTVDGPGRLLRAPERRSDPEQAWLELTGSGRLEHERHAPLALPAGWYRVVCRRVYEPPALGDVAEF
ncbi:hypothetical protein [Streptacidiphilus jiangxiensis]|uniref:Uncharacterized protein n=1 Tax=Streptacidiphilus jiangxiensis TaxID=235985 RepID=A0A1H7S0M8_STRJI|nr:hypothetical protein [Streptacidiphilus jiangxiensis]SEL65908.1 hypothetical protein SAMN05414137_11177 [Streptacidiphilus jiangxiensis]